LWPAPYIEKQEVLKMFAIIQGVPVEIGAGADAINVIDVLA